MLSTELYICGVLTLVRRVAPLTIERTSSPKHLEHGEPSPTVDNYYHYFKRIEMAQRQRVRDLYQQEELIVHSGNNALSAHDNLSPSIIRHNVKASREQREIRKLLTGYSGSIRPKGQKQSVEGKVLNPTVLNVTVTVLSLSSFNDVTMEFVAQLKFQQEWFDKRMTVTDPYFEENDALVLAEDQQPLLWIPDTFFHNEQKGHTHSVDRKNELIKIRTDGYITYHQRLTMSFSCPMDLQLFPHDTQYCVINFGSYAYTTRDIIYQWSNQGVIFAENANDDLPKFKLSRCKMKLCESATSTGIYGCLSVALTLQREFSFFLMTLYVPSCMLVSVSFVSFWIDWRSAPARVPLTIITLLTVTTQATGINANLPPVSYTKAIDLWIGSCIIFVFSALIEFAIVNYIGSNDERQRKMEAAAAMKHEDIPRLLQSIQPYDFNFPVTQPMQWPVTSRPPPSPSYAESQRHAQFFMPQQAAQVVPTTQDIQSDLQRRRNRSHMADPTMLPSTAILQSQPQQASIQQPQKHPGITTNTGAMSGSVTDTEKSAGSMHVSSMVFTGAQSGTQGTVELPPPPARKIVIVAKSPSRLPNIWDKLSRCRDVAGPANPPQTQDLGTSQVSTATSGVNAQKVPPTTTVPHQKHMPGITKPQVQTSRAVRSDPGGVAQYFERQNLLGAEMQQAHYERAVYPAQNVDPTSAKNLEHYTLQDDKLKGHSGTTKAPEEDAVQVKFAPYEARKKKKHWLIFGQNTSTAERIDIVSRIMFPLGFFLFNVAYWAAYWRAMEIEDGCDREEA